MNAASKEHLGVIELLSQYNADLNAKSQDGSTALIWASFKGHAESIETLVRLGADVILQDRRGQSACHFAAGNGHCQCVERLARAGADINVTDMFGETPLMLAAQSGHTCSVETLSSFGASTSNVNDSGWTAAHLAAKNGHSNCVEALAKFGADLNAVGDRSRKTPLINAGGNGHYSCLKVILSYEPRSYQFVVPGSGFTAIHFAAWKGHTECVRLLLQHGADLNGRSDSGLTPLDCLTSNQELEKKQRSECEEALKTMGAKEGSALSTQNRQLVDLSMTSQRAPWKERGPKPSTYRRYFSTK
jgi:ankyrin repeat protein